jgi:hypothetical protein
MCVIGGRVIRTAVGLETRVWPGDVGGDQGRSIVYACFDCQRRRPADSPLTQPALLPASICDHAFAEAVIEHEARGARHEATSRFGRLTRFHHADVVRRSWKMEVKRSPPTKTAGLKCRRAGN